MRGLLACSFAVLLIQPVQAGHGKAGTWQVSSRIDGGVTRAMLDFSRKLPLVDAKLKARGVQFGEDGRVVMRYCMTADEVTQDRPNLLHSSNCVTQNFKSKGDTFSADVICRGPVKGQGHVELTFTSPEHYKGRQVVTASLRGMELTRAVTFEGQWLANGCKGVP